MAYIKGKIQDGGNFIYPQTSLDKIFVVSGSTAAEAGVSILIENTNRIKADHLPETTVYTSGGTIAAGILPGTVVQTDGGKISASVLPTSVPLLDPITGKLSKDVLPAGVDDIVQLVAFSDNVPSGTFTDGNQYYNSTTRKIMTYSDSAWGSAATPTNDVIYFVPSTKTTYRWAVDASDTTYGGNMVAIAAAVAVTKQGSATGDQLTDSDDFVPSDKAVRAFVELAVAGGTASIADEDTPGIVYVSGLTSSAKGVKLTLNDTTGALAVTGVEANASTPGVVYVPGATSSAKGVELTLNTSTGALSVTGVEASGTAPGVVYVAGATSSANGVKLTLDPSTGALAVTGLAPDGATPGVVSLITGHTASEWTTYANTRATTPGAVEAYVEDTLNGNGIAISGTTATIALATSDSGLTLTGGKLKVSGLTGTQVAEGLNAGDGIASVAGGTITASLTFVPDQA